MVNRLHADYAAACLVVHINHLRNRAARCINQIIRQNHGKWLIAHRRQGAQHRVSQPQGFGLARVKTAYVGGQNVLHLG